MSAMVEIVVAKSDNPPLPLGEMTALQNLSRAEAAMGDCAALASAWPSLLEKGLIEKHDSYKLTEAGKKALMLK